MAFENFNPNSNTTKFYLVDPPVRNTTDEPVGGFCLIKGSMGIVIGSNHWILGNYTWEHCRDSKQSAGSSLASYRATHEILGFDDKPLSGKIASISATPI